MSRRLWSRLLPVKIPRRKEMVKRMLGSLLIMSFLVSGALGGEQEEGLKARSQAWLTAYNAGDAKTLSSIYTQDAMLLPPNAEFVKGRESIEKFWTAFIKGTKGNLEIHEAIIEGDLGYLLGTFTVFDSNDKVLDRGKYTEVWIRGNGQWQLHRDIWNTSLPSSPSAAP